MKKLGLLVIFTLLGISPAVAGSSSSPSASPKGMAMVMPTAPPLTGSPAKMGGTLLDAPIPSAVLAIPLQDATGKTFTLSSLKGRSIILTDFFTSCDMICPMTTANMRNIGDAITRAGLSKKFVVLELSVDAQRDTVARIRAYQNLFGQAKPSWTVATGSVPGLKTFWAFFGVYAKNVPKADGESVDWQTGKRLAYDVEHANVVVLIDAKGHFRWLDLGNPAVKDATEVPAKLKLFLSDQGRLNLMHPQQWDWEPSAVYGAINQVLNLQIGSSMKMGK